MLGLFKKRSSHCYCAFCRSPRKVYVKKSISLLNIFTSAIAAAAMTYIIWQEVDPRGLLFLLCLLVVSEIAIQIRRRISLICKHCGFDPIIYIKNPEQAAEKVKLFLEKRKEDPNYLLAKPLNLPPQKKPSQKPLLQRGNRPGQLVSKQV